MSEETSGSHTYDWPRPHAPFAGELRLFGTYSEPGRDPRGWAVQGLGTETRPADRLPPWLAAQF